MSFKLPTPESIELPDAPVAFPSRKLTSAECIQLCCQLNEDKRQETLQEFAALYPHRSPQQVRAVVSKFMLLAAGLERDHPVFALPFYANLPPDYSFEHNF